MHHINHLPIKYLTLQDIYLINDPWSVKSNASFCKKKKKVLCMVNVNNKTVYNVNKILLFNTFLVDCCSDQRWFHLLLDTLWDSELMVNLFSFLHHSPSQYVALPLCQDFHCVQPTNLLHLQQAF